MVVLEAWMHGMALVTTPVGGLPDVLEEGRNALTFPFGDADDHRTPSESVERDAEHGYGCKEGDVLALLTTVVVCLPYSPDDSGNKEDDVDNLASVERAAKSVDEEQLKPTAHADDARNNSIEHCRQDNSRDAQGYERALEVGIALKVGILAIVIHKHDGRQAKQIEQVDTNTQSRHECD